MTRIKSYLDTQSKSLKQSDTDSLMASTTHLDGHERLSLASTGSDSDVSTKGTTHKKRKEISPLDADKKMKNRSWFGKKFQRKAAHSQHAQNDTGD